MVGVVVELGKHWPEDSAAEAYLSVRSFGRHGYLCVLCGFVRGGFVSLVCYFLAGHH